MKFASKPKRSALKAPAKGRAGPRKPAARRRRVELERPTRKEDAAISAAIASDPDTFEASEEQFASALRGRPPLAPEERKQRVTIFLDPEVVAHFKAGGPGWQTRANAALAAHVRQAKSRGR